MIGEKLFPLVILTSLLSLASCSPNGDWGASWIGAPWESDTFDADNVPPAPVFRKQFKLDKEVSSATIKICGLGLFELSMNGEKVGDDVFVPNESLYDYRPGMGDDPILPLNGENFRNYRQYYLEYDLLPYLMKGENEMRVILGNGFYSSESRRYICAYGTPRLICRVDIEYADGSSDSIVSDRSFQVAKSPILMNDLFDGEIYDARLEGCEQWEKPALRKAPAGELTLQTGPSDKVMQELQPVSLVKLPDGDWEADFGDYVTGWVCLNGLSSIPRGRVIEVLYPTDEYGNGVQKFISSGSHVAQSYRPHFTWYTFRKVRIRGFEKLLKPKHLTAQVIYSDVPTTGHFECSDTLINKINHIFWRAQTDNMHLCVPTDCPHRERGPYTGDGQVSCTAVMHLLGADSFYRKWIRDIADCQDVETGYVPNGAPWHIGCGGGVPWGAAMNIVPWEHYLHYGDKSVLEENYFAMTEQLRHMCSWVDADGIMLQKKCDKDGNELYWLNLGEWSTPDKIPEMALVHTYYLWKCASNTAKAAGVLGKTGDAEKYEKLAADTYSAFHKKFYDPQTHSYGYNDGSNIFALDMGVPEEYRTGVVNTVRQELKDNGGHLNTGIYGTKLFFEVLCDNGMADLAYAAMTKTDFPSFGYWVVQGAQTMYEYWDGHASHVHPMFGGGLVWLYRRVAGVCTDENEPGYKHIIIRPHPGGGLKWAEYSTETAYGKLSVSWQYESGRFVLDADIPEGTHASIYLPGSSKAVETQSGHWTNR